MISKEELILLLNMECYNDIFEMHYEEDKACITFKANFECVIDNSEMNEVSNHIQTYMERRNSVRPIKLNIKELAKEKGKIKNYEQFCKTEEAKESALTEDEILYYNELKNKKKGEKNV